MPALQRADSAPDELDLSVQGDRELGTAVVAAAPVYAFLLAAEIVTWVGARSTQRPYRERLASSGAARWFATPHAGSSARPFPSVPLDASSKRFFACAGGSVDENGPWRAENVDRFGCVGKSLAGRVGDCRMRAVDDGWTMTT